MTYPITVLVVEDEPLVRMNIADEFSELGFTVVEAGNARDALAMLGLDRLVSVLFTDIDMPGRMDGLMLSEVVRQRWPDIKIIVTSGHRRMHARDLPLDSRFFPKPYTAEAVASAMREMAA